MTCGEPASIVQEAETLKYAVRAISTNCQTRENVVRRGRRAGEMPGFHNLVLDFDLDRKYNDFIKTRERFQMRPAEQIVEDLNKAREQAKAADAKVMALGQELNDIYQYVSEQLGLNKTPNMYGVVA